MDPGDLLNKLEPEYLALLKEQETLKYFEDQLQKKTKDIINEHYAREVHTLSAEGYRALEDAVYSCTSKLAIDIVNVFHRHVE
jgi:hypothetical protein